MSRRIRAVRIGEFPKFCVRQMGHCPTLLTNYTTDILDIYAFVGLGRVWAVGELLSAFPDTGKGQQRYVWTFQNFHAIQSEIIECPDVAPPWFFANGPVMEPKFINATTEKYLRQYLESVGWPPYTGTQQVEVKQGQISMF
jgi:hypothetical protein